MYYIYGHYLGGKCIYIGSNHHRGSENRAYDFSDRNKKYAEVTKNRKDEIEVKILKEFPDIEVINEQNGIIQKEEHRIIQEFHDKGEALCSNEDLRGERHFMYGKHHSKETIEKNRQSNIDYWANHNHPWKGKEHTTSAKELMSKAKKGKIWVYKDNDTKSCRLILPEDLDYYISLGYTKGRHNKK